jgi:phospholipid/cholesterol/gamma-HCH transport system substrate-binding protein
MRRALVATLVVIAALVAVVFGAGASGEGGGDYKVRGIFDNASFLIEGQDVKTAGAKIGTVDELDVHSDPSGAKKAAIVLKIERDGFKNFRSDARCEIRLQSVIGEKLVECTPTQPRPEGAPLPPPLKKIPEGQPGAGQYLLPVENTTTPIDADLINAIQRRPFRQRLSIILNELGAGLAARGEDIKELIRRANPALREFDDFLKILAGQNKMLRRLTEDADTVLTALARERESVADFFVQSRVAAQATAEKREDLERNFAKFPAFLRQLRPFMLRFDELSSEMAPVISDLRAAGPDISRFMAALGPFSESSRRALISLGDTADVGRRALVAAKPVAERLATFTSEGRRVGRNLRLLLTSIEEHKGIERFVNLLFYVTMSVNGFDEVGHYLRNALIVTVCSGYSITPTVGCSANFAGSAEGSAAASSRGDVGVIARRLIKAIGGRKRTTRSGKRRKAEVRRSRDRRATERRTAAGGGSASPQEAPSASSPSAPSPSAPSPSAPSPSGPAPARAPSIDGKPAGEGDPVLDYLLGGSR